ncbi:MAG: cytochrome c family protein [Myxococcaceae bacterium]|nr:cytochrome c family protein [Myxococcaceae bacterium]MCI0673632.1 cytochrome c family protein [Myxococcaceae bacterium]
MSSLLFPRWTNTVSRLTAALLLSLPAVAIGGLMLYVRSPLANAQSHPVEQPFEFDHRHHTGDEAIDCRYCHHMVEESSTAGIPSTTLCVSCHAQVWNKSPYLAQLREKFFTDQPIPWVRVHNLPEYVYFNHSIHVNKGVGCVTCHGRVDQMAAIYQKEPLTMAWCLECHRNPGPNLRPVEFMTSMTWQPEKDPGLRAAQIQDLTAKYDVHARTSCDTCHR